MAWEKPDPIASGSRFSFFHPRFLISPPTDTLMCGSASIQESCGSAYHRFRYSVQLKQHQVMQNTRQDKGASPPRQSGSLRGHRIDWASPGRKLRRTVLSIK